MELQPIDLALTALKRLGILGLCRRLKRPGILILCYHGFSRADEHEFAPLLFMRREVFLRRMELLARSGLEVIDLDTALEKLRTGDIRTNYAVVTLDDGWVGCHETLLEMSRRFGFPCTLYVTTYYIEHPLPVFNVLFRYLLFQARDRSLPLAGLVEGRADSIDLRRSEGRAAALAVLNEYSERLPRAGRLDFTRRCAAALGIDLDRIDGKGVARLMTPAQVRELTAAGVDIQLHTHRHFGRKTVDEPELLAPEIDRNRELLGPLAGRELRHFAYPSGYCHPRQIPWLERLGVHSAVTTNLGWNFSGASPYALKRFVDGDSTPEIRFEAELAGVTDLLRRLRQTIGGN